MPTRFLINQNSLVVYRAIYYCCRQLFVMLERQSVCPFAVLPDAFDKKKPRNLGVLRKTAKIQICQKLEDIYGVRSEKNSFIGNFFFLKK